MTFFSWSRKAQGTPYPEGTPFRLFKIVVKLDVVVSQVIMTSVLPSSAQREYLQ